MNKRISLLVILIFSIFMVSVYAQEGSLGIKVDSSGVVTITGVVEKGEYILKVYKGDMLVHIDQLETEEEISYTFIPRIKEEDAIYRMILGVDEVDFRYDTRRSRPPKEDIDGNVAIENALASTETPVLSLGNDTDALVQISPHTIQVLENEERPLIVENTGISLNFASQSLMKPVLNQTLGKESAKLELGAKALMDKEKKEILAKAPIGESTGLFEVGGKIFDLTAQIITKNPDGTTTKDKIEQFHSPVAVTIDLSDLKLTKEELEKLTGVRYEKDEKGNIDLVKLGGKYDSATKSFTFYTDQFSLYSVVKAEKLTQINLTIGSFKSSVNGKDVTNDVAPLIINERTMVPVRFIAESFGAEVEWIEETRTVVIKLDGETLTMIIDKPIEGFDTPPTIVNDRTLVPLRYVSEELGANVQWFPDSKLVKIVR